MKHAVEIGSCVMLYIPSFIQTGSAIRKLIGGRVGLHRRTDIEAQKWHGDRISLLLFFQNKESRLIKRFVLYVSLLNIFSTV
jgi:hypothetical protein